MNTNDQNLPNERQSAPTDAAEPAPAHLETPPPQPFGGTPCSASPVSERPIAPTDEGMTTKEFARMVNRAAEASPDRKIVISVDGREWDIKTIFGPWEGPNLPGAKYEIQARTGPYELDHRRSRDSRSQSQSEGSLQSVAPSAACTTVEKDRTSPRTPLRRTVEDQIPLSRLGGTDESRQIVGRSLDGGLNGGSESAAER